MDFNGKHIFITGAGRGLGAAYAVILADLGSVLTIAGRNLENLDTLAESIRLRTGTKPKTISMDLADISQVTLFARKWCDENQPLDILINNGAQWLAGKMDEHDAYAIANTITANVTGTLLLTRGLLPLLKKSSAADIVNIVAISGMANVPQQTASIAMLASKYGQAGLTDGLRQELRGENVRLTALYPPYIKDISPLDEVEWNMARGAESWITNKDMLDATLSALARARHVSYQSIMLETDTSNFHFHKA